MTARIGTSGGTCLSLAVVGPVSAGFSPRMGTASGATFSACSGDARLAGETNGSAGQVAFDQHQQTQFLVADLDLDSAAVATIGSIGCISSVAPVTPGASVGASSIPSCIPTSGAIGAALTVTASPPVATPSPCGLNKNIAISLNLNALEIEFLLFPVLEDGSRNPQGLVAGTACGAQIEFDPTRVVTTFGGACIATMSTVCPGQPRQVEVVLTCFSVLSWCSADVDQVQDFAFAI